MMVLDADSNAGILDTHIGVTSFMVTMVIADDDLSWWSGDWKNLWQELRGFEAKMRDDPEGFSWNWRKAFSLVLVVPPRLPARSLGRPRRPKGEC